MGTTPLEYSLRTAINSDFISNNDLKHIILITDGGESCDGDPCRFIQSVIRNRKDIRIDIIAISVSDDDFQQLKCISNATNGKIYNVLNPNELLNAYNNVLPNINLKYNTQSNVQYPNNYGVTYKNYHFETYE